MVRYPLTQAIIYLDKAKVDYTPHLYNYHQSGAIFAAKQLGIDEHLVIKTLVMADEEQEPFIILMHGTMRVSTKELARQLGVKKVSPCSRRKIQRYTGYIVGGISPFGTKRVLPIYVEKTILDLPKLYINAGRRGFVVEMKPSELVRVLKPKLVNVAR